MFVYVPGVELGRANRVRGLGGFCGEPEGVSGVERGDVGSCHLGPLRELRLDPLDRRLLGAVEQPGEEAEGEEVLRSQNIATTHPGVLDRLLGERVHRNLDHLVSDERVGADRADVVSGLCEIALVEGVRVDDQGPGRSQVGEVGLESRRIHGDETIGLIARRQNVEIGDLYLERADPGKGSGRCPDLRGKARQGGQVVSEGCRCVGESGTGQLHSVAGVAGKPYDYSFQLGG